MYLISDLERISGIKAHTIRMWEKRYNLLEPQRTEGNHRLYSDDDLIKLLNVEKLVSCGFKISKIATWSRYRIKEKMRMLFKEDTDEHSDVAYYNHEWLQSVLKYDEQKFEAIYRDLRSRLSFIELWRSYLVPGLQYMGKLWMTEDLMPAEEHFFSHLVHRKILTEFDDLVLPDPNQEPLLLFLPPGEYHELGLLVTDYMLRKQGRHTINLGPDLPLENLKKVIEDLNVSILISFIQGMKINPEFMDYIITLRSFGKQVVLNGRIHDEDGGKIKSHPHILQISSVDAFEIFVSGNLKLTS